MTENLKIFAGLCLLFGLLGIGEKSGATTCDIEVEVPFKWELERTGKNSAQVIVINDEGTGSSKLGSDTLAGEFIITAIHTPP